jgi:hypothetical protein
MDDESFLLQFALDVLTWRLNQNQKAHFGSYIHEHSVKDGITQSIFVRSKERNEEHI